MLTFLRRSRLAQLLGTDLCFVAIAQRPLTKRRNGWATRTFRAAYLGL